MNNTMKSTLAVGTGLLVFVAVSVATGVAWGKYSAGLYPNAIMITMMLGAILAGYVAALVAGRTQLGHALSLWLVVITWNLVVRLLELHHDTTYQSWPHWIVGVTNTFTWFSTGGLFRYWQATRQKKRAAQPLSSPASPRDTSAS